MDLRHRLAIINFASAVRELRAAGVIRSHRYLGDLAEFLCAKAFDIDLASNLRQVGHDGMREQLRVQIKYNGGKKTNVGLGDPTTYDEVYVVLGPDSVIRKYDHPADFLIYKLTAKAVQDKGPTIGGEYSCGAECFNREPDRAISLAEPPATSNEEEAQADEL